MHDAPPAVECRRGVRPSSVWRVSLAARQLLVSPRQLKTVRESCHVHSVRRSAPSVLSERRESLGDTPRCDAHRGQAGAVPALADPDVRWRGAVARHARASRRRRSRREMICRALDVHRMIGPERLTIHDQGPRTPPRALSATVMRIVVITIVVNPVDDLCKPQAVRVRTERFPTRRYSMQSDARAPTQPLRSRRAHRSR